MKRLFALILALTMVFSMAACAKDVPAPTTQAPETAAPAAEVTESGYYPITLTDQAGRTVTIESQPERLVSGYYISSSLLMALGQADKLVGIEAKADKRPIYKLSAPELLDLPSVGTAKEFDLEGCAALEPDLVILPMKLKEAADTLTSLGIPVLVVNPENQQLLYETIELTAQALNCMGKASELFKFYNQTAEKLVKTLNPAATGTELPRVYLGGNSSFLSTAGVNMYQGRLIDLAGGINVAADIEDSYWAEVSYEQILAWNPEVIFLASDAKYTVADVLADGNLAGVAAIEHGRVYQLPNAAEAWDSPVPGGILGAVWMASRLHGDLIPEEVCNALVGDFYRNFYGFEYGGA